MDKEQTVFSHDVHTACQQGIVSLPVKSALWVFVRYVRHDKAVVLRLKERMNKRVGRYTLRDSAWLVEGWKVL